jgi:biotin-(acetyl-CoA carboxylase) ligase
MRLDTTVGREVLVAAPSRTLAGKAEAIDGSGRLILRLLDGSVTAVSSGDVTVLNQL